MALSCPHLGRSLKQNSIFDVRSFYTALRVLPCVDFPWKSIWHNKAPRRACFFVWTAAWNKILTCDNLHKRGYSFPSWCCMCCSNGETVDHLLLHCPVQMSYGLGVSRLLGFNGSYLGLLLLCYLVGKMG
jgi:hypothetical protein